MVDCEANAVAVGRPQGQFFISGLSMITGPKVFYEFGPFRVDPEKQVLLRDNEPIAITPKTFETLLILVRHSREVVSKDDLMKELWPDSFVEESNLSQNIFMLRKALGDTPDDRRYIVTLPGKGYRFVAEVRAVAQAGEDVIVSSHTRTQMVMETPAAVPAVTLPALPTATAGRFNRKYIVAAVAAVVLLAADGGCLPATAADACSGGEGRRCHRRLHECDGRSSV